MIPTDIEKAYIAGFFDGEGSFGISPNLSQVMIELTSTNEDILTWICTFFKFGRYSRAKQPRAKQTYRIFITGSEEARTFIESIGPYIKIKKEQVEVIRDFLNTISVRANRHGVSDETMLQRAILKNRIGKLNQRGDDSE